MTQLQDECKGLAARGHFIAIGLCMSDQKRQETRARTAKQGHSDLKVEDYDYALLFYYRC